MNHATVRSERIVNYSHAQFSRELTGEEEETMAKQKARIVINRVGRISEAPPPALAGIAAGTYGNSEANYLPRRLLGLGLIRRSATS